MSDYDDSEEAIRARDAAIHVCDKCDRRYYGKQDDQDTHNFDVDECERRMRVDVAEHGRKPRAPDPETGRLCWNPSDHHEFVEGPIPHYEDGDRDRRTLLRLLDEERAAARAHLSGVPQ